jgi:IS30 family transposase
VSTQGATSFELEQRQRIVMERYLAGNSMRKIAEELNVAVGTVWNDVNAIRKHWREQSVDEYDLWKDRELERIDKLEMAAWQGWNRSTQDAVKITEEHSPDGSKNSMTTQGQAGDAAFLAILARCIEQRCKILGLYAPIRQQINTNGVTIKYVVGVDESKV